MNESGVSQLIPVLPVVNEFMARRHGLWIDGEYVESTGNRRLDVFDPSTGKVISSVVDASSADVSRAVEAARRAFTPWARCRPVDRERLLLKLADIVEANSEALAQLETLNQGKSIHASRAIEVGGSVEYIRYMAGWATKIEGTSSDLSIPIPKGARNLGLTLREPVGVVGAIVPWNFPLSIAVWKLASALACGCTIVLKPSEDTPLTALYLAGLTRSAGFPPGVVNVVTGSGINAGAALASHPDIDKLTFTGSTEVGKEIGRMALGNMTRFTLELGGKNPMIVMNDVDPEQILPGLMGGCFFNQGQVCAAGSRLYIHREIFDKTIEHLVASMKSMSLGPGLNPSAALQPLTSERHRTRVLNAVMTSRAEGAEVITGGNVPERDGYYFEPTLLINQASTSRAMQREIFGPVIAAVPIGSLDEAIGMANDSQYGLAASIWTNDLNGALRAAREIEAGTIWINSHIPLDPSLPFGGVKQSGYGREHGRGAIEQYTEIKSLVIPVFH
ncbi:aldehyde dehydrogenase family protein [Paraburkholderia sp. J63]|uniref:aldehyde dehydrogenase family protein n=1 Tax=Paraburkholderia sp. J63 TaxID=2805434 RepID=UPI002ABDA0A8|nr:aldehyde dehydrogenase family protein [Paraburkholderia sp. J63]